MPSQAATYFNTVLRHLNPEATLQLQPFIIRFQEVSVVDSKTETELAHVQTVSTEHVMVESSKPQVFLVEIHNSLTMQKNNVVSTKTNNHFGLLVTSGNNSNFYFDPLSTFKKQGHVIQLLKAHLADGTLTLLPCHPQQGYPDVFCMAYVCMFASAILESLADETFSRFNLNRLCHDVFDVQASITKNRVIEFLRHASTLVGHDLALPLGGDVGEWFDKHKAAVLGGAGAGLVFGPVGIIGGIVGGEILYDKGHREDKF